MTTDNAILAEWTKLRTVRGWKVALGLIVLLTVVLGYLVGNGANSGTCVPSGVGQPICGVGHPFVPTGPNGEAVADSYYLVSRRLTGNGTITARVIGLTGVTSSGSTNAAPSLLRTRRGLAGWAKAGLIITTSARQGSPYAAVMVTARHGVRFQYDFTHDAAGLTGAPAFATPRWLRLARSGSRLTAYDSINGVAWHTLGTVTLHALAETVTVGLFATSPVTYDGHPTQATGSFDEVTMSGTRATAVWHGSAIGEQQTQFYPVLGKGRYDRRGNAFRVSGSGDISLGVNAPGDTAASVLTQALIVTLLVVVVLAASFITSEYRRGLIKTTFAATPARGRILAAKAVVIGAAAFVASTIGAAIAAALGEHLLRHNGNYVFPTSTLTELRVIIGAGVMVALIAIAVLALGTLLRRASGTVLTSVVLFVFPAIVAVPFMSGGGTGSTPTWVAWLLRLTPGAGMSVVTSLPRSPLVDYPYTISNGYLPLSPAAGLSVVAVWALGLSALAVVRLKRGDA